MPGPIHKSGSQKRKERRQKEQLRAADPNKNVLTNFFVPAQKAVSSQATNCQEVELANVSDGATTTCEQEDATVTENVQHVEPTTDFEPTASAESSDNILPCTSASLEPEPERQTQAAGQTGEACETEESVGSEGYDDPGKWPEKITHIERENIVRALAGIDNITLLKGISAKDSEGKPFPDYLLYSQTANGREKVKRDWLLLSKCNMSLHCVPCILFSEEVEQKSQSALNSKEGLRASTTKWQKLYSKLPEHEKSTPHKHCYWKWRNLQHSLLKGTGVDGQFQKEFQTQVEKNRALLERLLDVTLFLASRNLAFRGDNDELGDIHNGNFLGLLELISHYDSIMREHLEKVKEYRQKGERLPSHYLSWRSQNEFIELCGQHVQNTILEERLQSIYFSIICDATPDISNVEQNTLLLRYVSNDVNGKGWIINERFIEFIDFAKKTGKEIANMIEGALQRHGIDIADCRGQGYDNGSNMSGKVKGVQAQIIQVNPLATFSPCASHTLNLVGVHAVQSCKEMSTFFGCVNRLYTLFSASVDRWAVWKEKTRCSLHRLSDTRWSARIDAVRPVARHLPSVIEAIECIMSSCKLSNEALSDARGLKEYFTSFKAIVLCSVWVKILQHIEDRNLLFQSGSLSLDQEMANIEALIQEIISLRNEWDSLLSEAQNVANAMGVPPEFDHSRQRKRQRIEDAQPQETPDVTFRNSVFYVAVDSIIAQLNSRFQSIRNICNDFKGILKFQQLSEEDLSASCRNLKSKYSKDLSEDFEKQMLHLKSIYSATFSVSLTPIELLNRIYDMKLESIYGDICIALRIFCTLPVSVAGGERSFSKLKIIKNYMRSTMSQERLNNLAILSIECQLAQQIDFKDIIKDFASRKTRRMLL